MPILFEAKCVVEQIQAKTNATCSLCRIESIVSLLKQNNPNTIIILVGVLPRGDSKSGNTYSEPNKYTQSIKNVNGELQKYADKQDQVVFVDCKEQLLIDGQASTVPQECAVTFQHEIVHAKNASELSQREATCHICA